MISREAWARWDEGTFLPQCRAGWNTSLQWSGSLAAAGRTFVVVSCVSVMWSFIICLRLNWHSWAGELGVQVSSWWQDRGVLFGIHDSMTLRKRLTLKSTFSVCVQKNWQWPGNQLINGAITENFHLLDSLLQRIIFYHSVNNPFLLPLKPCDLERTGSKRWHPPKVRSTRNCVFHTYSRGLSNYQATRGNNQPLFLSLLSYP